MTNEPIEGRDILRFSQNIDYILQQRFVVKLFICIIPRDAPPAVSSERKPCPPRYNIVFPRLYIHDKSTLLPCRDATVTKLKSAQNGSVHFFCVMVGLKRR